MRPQFFCFMCGHTAFEQLKAPVRLTFRSRSQSASTWLSTVPMWSSVPALFTRMSRLPNSPTTWSTTALTCSRFVTSIFKATERRPISRISLDVFSEKTAFCEAIACESTLWEASAVFSSSGSLSIKMSVTTTSAPARARARQSARPRPRDPPVTRATFPLRSIMASSPSGSGA